MCVHKMARLRYEHLVSLKSSSLEVLDEDIVKACPSMGFALVRPTPQFFHDCLEASIIPDSLNSIIDCRLIINVLTLAVVR